MRKLREYKRVLVDCWLRSRGDSRPRLSRRSEAPQVFMNERRCRFVLCVGNKNYPASLELRKVYRLLSDEQASKRHQVRVVDESGEDYLYPEEYFVPIKLPQAAEKVVLRS
jgi:hypothetical protein